MKMLGLEALAEEEETKFGGLGTVEANAIVVRQFVTKSVQRNDIRVSFEAVWLQNIGTD